MKNGKLLGGQGPSFTRRVPGPGVRQEKSLANVVWCIGDVARLPFGDGAFSIAVSRFAFHHMLAPDVVLSEMVRVCRPGGRIAVVDVAVSPVPEKAAAYNTMEKLR